MYLASPPWCWVIFTLPVTLKSWSHSTSPLKTLSSHTLNSPTRINNFQNTGLFRSCTLNPAGMFPQSHRGKWLTPPQRTPCCPAFEICLLNSLLRYSRATTINFSSSSIYFWIDSLHLLNPPGEYCSGLCHGKRVAALHHWLILDERSFTKSYQALWQSPGLVPCMS